MIEYSRLEHVIDDLVTLFLLGFDNISILFTPFSLSFSQFFQLLFFSPGSHPFSRSTGSPLNTDWRLLGRPFA